jgi:hypothetical protein
MSTHSFSSKAVPTRTILSYTRIFTMLFITSSRLSKNFFSAAESLDVAVVEAVEAVVIMLLLLLWVVVVVADAEGNDCGEEEEEDDDDDDDDDVSTAFAGGVLSVRTPPTLLPLDDSGCAGVADFNNCC